MRWRVARPEGESRRTLCRGRTARFFTVRLTIDPGSGDAMQSRLFLLRRPRRLGQSDRYCHRLMQQPLELRWRGVFPAQGRRRETAPLVLAVEGEGRPYGAELRRQWRLEWSDLRRHDDDVGTPLRSVCVLEFPFSHGVALQGFAL